MLFDNIDPMIDLFKSLSICNVETDQCPMCAAKVSRCHRIEESFLSSSVPQLVLYSLLINFYVFNEQLYAKTWGSIGFKLVPSEAVKKTRFPGMVSAYHV